MSLTYDITTPERKVEEGSASYITLPTTQGYITILPNHVPLISTLGAGEIVIRKDNEEAFFATEGGFLEIRDTNHVSILADFTAPAFELDIDVIEKARKKAEENLKQKKFTDDEHFAAAAAMLERELAKLKVARKRRRKG